MDLNEEQRRNVREWVAAGASLSDVQRRIKGEFGVTMTFIETRMLVIDLGAEVKDKPEPKPAPPPPPPPKPAPPPEAEDPYAEDFEDEEAPPLGPEEAAGAANVSLSLDRLVVPGAMVSGTVAFSDGMKARWLIDQYGRFGLEPETPGYRPSGPDLQSFQAQLRAELKRHGYA